MCNGKILCEFEIEGSVIKRCFNEGQFRIEEMTCMSVCAKRIQPFTLT